jgi:CRISPR/Cas system-associated exonuclease Cas4 (RecB family)
MPWTGARIENWGILIESTGEEFVSLGNSTSITINEFKENEKVLFYIRSKLNGRWLEWGSRLECIV